MKNRGHQRFLSTRAFTLVEVMISVAIFTILFGACFTVLLSGSDSWQVNSAEMQLQQELRKAMDWLKEDLAEGGISTITNVPADWNWYSTITFKAPSGVTSGAITWGSNTIQFVLSSNQLRRIEGATTKVIAQNISSLQFRRQASTPHLVEVSLQAQKSSIKGTISKTLSFKVQMRN